MCGLTGFLGWTPHAERILERMSDAIRHRGPDSAGVWHDAAACVGLGHRRLAIVDLSPAGHQPMMSKSGRYVIAFNGEIYNHLALRKDLPSVWRGHSDTETLLAGFEQWGIRGTVERAIGMFAFAVWDRDARVLTLGRDRLGEKPLYYGRQGEGNAAVFLFGSELAALRAHPSFEAPIDRDALALLMRHGNVPAPYSIFKGIRKLEPGSLLTVSADGAETHLDTYWSGAEVAVRGIEYPFAGSAEDAVRALDGLLKDAIGQQMMADVPLGAFLSGGVDSSTVVALMQAQSSQPVRTFSIGFHDATFNEAVYAKAVAQHLGTNHTELYLTPEQAMETIVDLPSVYDEPFADSSQIPTLLVSRMARERVTVSLSGDAGDELFAGYNRYQVAATGWKRLSKAPRALRRAGAWGITRISPHTWHTLLEKTPFTRRWSDLGSKLHKLADVMGAESLAELYIGLVSQWREPETIVRLAHEPPTRLTGALPPLPGLNDVERMMALDMLTYLTDDILTKVDRAAMSTSLETRVPMLDHRVVEFAWSLPLQYKLRDGATKWPLRQILYQHVPQQLIERPKMGFAVPLDAWLRGPLRAWAESLLSESRLRAEGYFDPEPIRRKWEEHVSGRRNWQSQLWNVLMFQSWLEGQRG